MTTFQMVIYTVAVLVVGASGGIAILMVASMGADE